MAKLCQEATCQISRKKAVVLTTAGTVRRAATTILQAVINLWGFRSVGLSVGPGQPSHKEVTFCFFFHSLQVTIKTNLVMNEPFVAAYYDTTNSIVVFEGMLSYYKQYGFLKGSPACLFCIFLGAPVRKMCHRLLLIGCLLYIPNSVALENIYPVSYTHLTLPTIYSV